MILKTVSAVLSSYITMPEKRIVITLNEVQKWLRVQTLKQRKKVIKTLIVIHLHLRGQYIV